jgi:hypothetical protein
MRLTVATRQLAEDTSALAKFVPPAVGQPECSQAFLQHTYHQSFATVKACGFQINVGTS